MPPDVDVATDPLIVYGMVAVFVVATLLAFWFARPRRGLGAVTPADVPHGEPDDLPWMPGGDILGRDPERAAETPAANDPWSTGAADQGPQGRWDRR